MGKEYFIECGAVPERELEQWLAGVDNPTNQEGWRAFDATVTEQGLYFCDHCWSEAASVGLRKLIDLALSRSERVVVKEE
ncbi:hypothetical protein [Aeoliella sp.]|uniref:hypothetical protein n=1 Tax=Aeoliella sp. TaxID=2795800 RepID=UPI003CCBF38B